MVGQPLVPLPRRRTIRVERFQQSYNADRPSRARWTLTTAAHGGTFAPAPIRLSRLSGESTGRHDKYYFA